jgi:outer membrane protein assembly complex protein YaeT
VPLFRTPPTHWLPRLYPLLAVLCVLTFAAGCVEGEQGAIRVNQLKFSGIKAVKEGQLRAALATAKSSKLPWGAKHYFTREHFDADLKRITAFYRDRGYPDAKVKSFDVKLNQKQDAVDITVNIDEGQPTIVEAIEYNGFDVVPAGHFAELKRRIPLKTGQPLDRSLAQVTRESALDELKDHGYPYASVRLTDRIGSNDHARVLTISATPGVLARYGPIDITGNSSVSDAVVLRQLTFRPGGRYRLSNIEESQRKLYQLETFQFANIEPEVPEGQQPELVPTKVTVTEGKHRKVNFGVGYGSEEKARTTIDWRHVNFFGGARTIQIAGRYSSLDRGVRANFKQPAFIAPQFGLTLSGQKWHNDEPIYTLDTQGGSISIERPLARAGPMSQRVATTTLSLTYTNQYETYQVSPEALLDDSFRPTFISLGLNPETGRDAGLLSSLDFDIRRGTVDPQVNARSGYVSSLHVEQAGKMLGGKYDYWEMIAEVRGYLALGQRALVAIRVRGGSLNPWGDREARIPFFKRYFLGGASSLRGWGRFEVSPLTPKGNPIGGFSQFQSSAELRVPVWGSLSGVAFMDVGGVSNETWRIDLRGLRYDVGPGLRYNTPIGPIRVDVGYQLNPIPGLLIKGKPETRHFRVHFSIGQAF